jgi:hypothetical protein
MRQDLIIIVDPHRADLLPRLQAQFGDVMITLDRRRGDRRQTNQTDRREPLTWSQVELYRTEGYRIVCLVRGDATPTPCA